MHRVSALLFVLLLAPSCLAERYKLTFVPGSTAGEQLELIQHQIETQRKIEQMERFLQQFPNHEAGSYLLEWMHSYYARGNQPDQTLAMGERLLARHPDDFDAVWRCRRAAELKNDPALVRKWNERALQLAGKIVTAPKPQGMEESDWKQTLELARGLLDHEEYALFTKSLQLASTRERTAALESFLHRYPQSKYGAQIWPHLMNAYRAAGDGAKALAAADRLLAADPVNLDALLLSGHILLEQRKNFAKVQANGNRVLELMATQPKPKDMLPQEWEKRKDYYIGSAHLMIGNSYVNSNNFVMADKHLRVALPVLKGSGSTEAAILFYLGWANYNMEKYPESASYFRQCVEFGGQFGEQASKNIAAMQRERRIP